MKPLLVPIALLGVTMVGGCRPNEAFSPGDTEGDSDSASGTDTTSNTASASDSTTATTSDSASAGTDSNSGGTTGTSGASAGTDSGSTGPGCLDQDDDGFTDCDGDCDDLDPMTYPGAGEICGDDADNDCDGTKDPDTLCMGLGTWVSTHTGDDVNGDGTQQNPVKTIAQGMQNATTIGNGQDVFVAEGTYMEAISLVEGMSLYGGYECNQQSCTWKREPKTYRSLLLATGHTGLYVDNTITRITELDGFELYGQDGNPGSGGNIASMTVKGGTPTISNNKIVGAVVSGCSPWCGSTGLRIDGGSNDPGGVLVVGNRLEGGKSVKSTCAVELVNAQNPPVAEIIWNDVQGGEGEWTRGVCAWASGKGTYIGFNTVAAGPTNGLNNSSSFGIMISGEPTVEGNMVNVPGGGVASCSAGSPTFWCGGLESEGATASIINNVIHGMEGARSTAVYMGDGEVPFGEIILNGNTLHGGGGGNLANSGISTAIACRTSLGMNAMVGKMRNNILGAGSGTYRFGMYEDNQPVGKTCQPVVYENNDIFFPVAVGSTDNAHRQWTAQGTQVLLPDVNAVNNLGYAGGNFSTDCMVDASGHIPANSACVDAGVSTEAPPTDLDGESRPQGGGIDVGADEAG